MANALALAHVASEAALASVCTRTCEKSHSKAASIIDNVGSGIENPPPMLGAISPAVSPQACRMMGPASWPPETASASHPLPIPACAWSKEEAPGPPPAAGRVAGEVRPEVVLRWFDGMARSPRIQSVLRNCAGVLVDEKAREKRAKLACLGGA